MVRSGTHGSRIVQLKALTSRFVSPLQGEGRGFESLSAHQLGFWRPLQVLLSVPAPAHPDVASSQRWW